MTRSNAQTITMTLTPEQQCALADALYLRSMSLVHNVPGTPRTVAICEVAECILDQLDYPVHAWMSESAAGRILARAD